MGNSAWALLAERSGNSREHKMRPQAVFFRILKVMMEWMSITYMKSYSPFSLSYSPKKHMETSYFAISKSNLIIQGLSQWINQNCLKPRRLFAQLKATCSWFWCLSVPCCKHSIPKVSNSLTWWRGCPQLQAQSDHITAHTAPLQALLNKCSLQTAALHSQRAHL